MSRSIHAVVQKITHLNRHRSFILLLLPALVLMFAGGLRGGTENFAAKDPGVRGGAPGGGSPIAGLTTNQLAFFDAGLSNFAEVDAVPNGLGPRFNAESCAQCHAQPAVGGSSPSVNPQVAAATDQGASNQVPSFITLNGPVREARFPFTFDFQHVDGGVHALFTISGRTDAPGCNIQQDNFAKAAQLGDLIFRIPTPVFGDGLIEEIADATILANLNSNQQQKHSLGIAGRPNTSGNDGTITRFGWKAQNKSVEVFSGEAYNVEMGVTNEAVQHRTGPDAGLPVQSHSGRQHQLRFRQHRVAQ